MTAAEPDIDLRAMQEAIEATEPLVNAVTVNDVANTVLHWAGSRSCPTTSGRSRTWLPRPRPVC